MCLLTPHEIIDIEERPPRYFNERRSDRLSFVKDATPRSSRSSFYSDRYLPPPPPHSHINPYHAQNLLPQFNNQFPYNESSTHFPRGNPIPGIGQGYIDEDDGTASTMSTPEMRYGNPHGMNQQYALPPNMRHHYPGRGTPIGGGGMPGVYPHSLGHAGPTHDMRGNFANPVGNPFNGQNGLHGNSYGNSYSNVGHGGYRR